MTTEESLQSVIGHHSIQGEFSLSGGGKSDTYIDLRSALLCSCGYKLVEWYAARLRELVYTDGRNWGATPVATGSFGALLIGGLARRGWGCVLWNPKGHGVEWSMGKGHHPQRVVLLDDVVTTGITLRALRSACERQGWEVVSEIVAVRREEAS